MKQVILFLSDKSSQWIVDQFNLLSAARNEQTEVFFLYHERNSVIPDSVKALNYYKFTSEVLHELGYTPLEESLIPGSCHFPLLKFYLDNRQYDYYWFIEDDISFNGNWDNLFQAYKNSTADFISTFIKGYSEDPQWYWWSKLKTNNKKILTENKMRSFNPIYRLSNAALGCIDNALKNGWSGHNEALFATLLYNRGFALTDMGGTGKFVEKGYENRFYTKSSLSHLPVELGDRLNCIYHPIKEKKVICLDKLKKNCVISAVGKDSLHREWIKENPDFDLHLIVYDNSYNRFYNDTDFISYEKGQKFKLVYNYLQKHPQYLEKYDYFFLPDDDIQMDAANISDLFLLMKKHCLQIAQPALSDSYYTYEHTLRDKFCKLRYTNFIEIMAPCFSREVLKKVLTTFNVNNSGWGIEYHWPLLIDFTGTEIAIVDQLYAIHTRPIQSFCMQNRKELVEYVEKNNLNHAILETGVIPTDSKTIRLIADRTTYKLVEGLCGSIAESLLKSTRYSENISAGLCGIAGISLSLANYSRISEKKRYADIASSMIEKMGESLVRIKANMSFYNGLPGFSWYIEYLAQHGFIENDTDDVLEEICNHINNQKIGEISRFNIEHILGVIPHYIRRMKNPLFSTNTELHKRERGTLIRILHLIDKWSKSLSTLETNTSLKNITDCILLLCQVKEIFNFPVVDSALQRLSVYIKQSNPGSQLSYLLKAYILILVAESMNHIQEKNKIVEELINNYEKDIENTEIQQMLDLYLLHKIYSQTKNPFFRVQALIILQKFIHKDEDEVSFLCKIRYSYKNEEDHLNTDRIIYLELILLSILSNKDLELDNCILLGSLPVT